MNALVNSLQVLCVSTDALFVLWGDQKSQKNVQTRCTWEHEGPENYFWSYGLKMIQVLAYKLEQENITTSWFPD